MFQSLTLVTRVIVVGLTLSVFAAIKNFVDGPFHEQNYLWLRLIIARIEIARGFVKISLYKFFNI